MQATLKSLQRWLFQLRGPETGEIVLVQRRIFILPTKAGLVFAIVLVLMLSGAVNYGLSLGFILTFLLASLAITGMLYTFRNLAGLRITAARTAPVFAGEHARFAVAIHNPTRTDRYSIALARKKQTRDPDVVDIPAERTAVAHAAIPTTRRGVLRPGRLTLYTRFPLGLYYAWSYIDLDTHCIVYPKPAPAGRPLPPPNPSGREGTGGGRGQDDFAGLREYHAGDSPRHIAWKAAARGDTLLTKQFSGRNTVELWLSLDLLSERTHFEEKISTLARWVLDAQAEGISYGLKLPGRSIAIGTGEAHCDRCLEALATFDGGSVEAAS
jgi:uncharacterized protein (DUF58 family)